MYVYIYINFNNGFVKYEMCFFYPLVNILGVWTTQMQYLILQEMGYEYVINLRINGILV